MGCSADSALIDVLAALVEFRIMESSILLQQTAVLRVAMIENASLVNTQQVVA